MNRLITMALIASSIPAFAAERIPDGKIIDRGTGLIGKLNLPEGVYKVEMPRKDLSISVGATKLPVAMGLGCWAAFHSMGTEDMVMGDLVLLEDQVNPVMSAALDGGLQVTALHNHFFWDTPKVMFMHIGGRGPEESLAAAVGKVFAIIKETASTPPTAPPAPAAGSLTLKDLENILGQKSEDKGGVFKFTFARKTQMGGHEIGAAMGVNTWAAFMGSDSAAAVDGDFAMSEGELQGVLKSLRKSGINIVAIHQHMIDEMPRVMFLHYWGMGPAKDLAKAVRAALDTQVP